MAPPTISAGDQTHYQGNSITAGLTWNEGDYPWMSNPGGLVDQIAATWAPTPARKIFATNSGVAATNSGVDAAVQTVTPVQKGVTVTHWGLAGQSAIDAAAPGYLAATMFELVPATVTSPVLILEWGTNDSAFIFLGSETIGDFTTAYESILDQILAHWPAARIICLSVLAIGERWSAGPVWGPGNPCDTEIAQVNSAISATATAKGATYLDNRAALLGQEVIQNPGHADGNILLLKNGFQFEAVHPKFNCMIDVMAAEFLATIPIQP